MRGLLRPLLLPLLRRDPHEVERRAERFAIRDADARTLVARLGAAFLGGYHAMLEAASVRDVEAQGARVEPHFRPFFFEGAAMGYLPRGYYVPGLGIANAERDLLALDPRHRYLYYVGLGFWYGFRHRKDPSRILELEPHVDRLSLPLCFDGFGFKTGFFDYVGNPAVRGLLERGPEEHRYALYQGFGRSLFFVHMEDEAAFARERTAAPAERRHDLELGRSLALGFTGVDRPDGILRHLAAARGGDDLPPRLLGVTWALTARELNDPAYFEQCTGRTTPENARLLRRLPLLCREALGRSRSYPEWQQLTGKAVVDAYAAATEARP